LLEYIASMLLRVQLFQGKTLKTRKETQYTVGTVAHVTVLCQVKCQRGGFNWLLRLGEHAQCKKEYIWVLASIVDSSSTTHEDGGLIIMY